MRISHIPFASAILFQIVALASYNYWPWRYNINNSVNILVLFCMLSAILGYISCGSKTVKGEIITPRNFIRYAILTSIILFLPTYISQVGYTLPDLRLSLGELYSNSDLTLDSSSSPIAYIRMAFGWLIVGLLPCTIIFWKNLSSLMRTLAILALILNISVYIFTGTNKLLFDYLIISFSSLALFKFKQSNLLKNIVGSIIVILLAAAVLLFFSKTQEERSGASAQYGVFPAANAVAFGLPDAPSTLRIGIYGLTGYMTQGYYALGLSLDEPFIWTYGVGSSTFASRQVDRILNTNISDQTYPARIEDYGWNRYNYWSSLYSWLASDFTFYGVPIVFFMMSFLVRLSLNTTIKYLNPIALSLYCQLLIGLYYAYANNQLLQSGESMFSLIITFILLFFTPKGNYIVMKNRISSGNRTLTVDNEENFNL